MKWPHLTALCLFVFGLGVAVGIFASRSAPAVPGSTPAAKPHSSIPAAPLASVTTPPAPSRLERIAETSPQPAPYDGARTITSRPALPPVLEPVAKGQVAWRTDPHEWNNVGRQTVGAAIQSQFWAVSRGELEHLATSLHLDAATRANLQRLHDEASTKLRAQFPTPESFAAFLIASQPAVEGMCIGGIHPNSISETDVTVSILLTSFGSDRFDTGSPQRFRRADSGEWLRVIGPAELSQWHQMLKWDRELSKSRTWAINAGR